MLGSPPNTSGWCRPQISDGWSGTSSSLWSSREYRNICTRPGTAALGDLARYNSTLNALSFRLLPRELTQTPSASASYICACLVKYPRSIAIFWTSIGQQWRIYSCLLRKGLAKWWSYLAPLARKDSRQTASCVARYPADYVDHRDGLMLSHRASSARLWLTAVVVPWHKFLRRGVPVVFGDAAVCDWPRWPALGNSCSCVRAHPCSPSEYKKTHDLHWIDQNALHRLSSSSLTGSTLKKPLFQFHTQNQFVSRQVDTRCCSPSPSSSLCHLFSHLPLADSSSSERMVRVTLTNVLQTTTSLLPKISWSRRGLHRKVRLDRNTTWWEQLSLIDHSLLTSILL